MKLNFTQAQITQLLGHILALLAGYAAAKQGFHMSSQDSAEIAGALSVVVGPLAAKMVAAEPVASDVVNEVAADVKASAPDAAAVAAEVLPQVMAALSDSLSSPRSALSMASERGPELVAPAASTVVPAAPQPESADVRHE